MLGFVGDHQARPYSDAYHDNAPRLSARHGAEEGQSGGPGSACRRTGHRVGRCIQHQGVFHGGCPHRSGDIAERLGVKFKSVAPTRNALINMGLTYIPRR